MMKSPTITSLMIWLRIASSGRVNAFSRSARLTIPTSRPASLTTGVA
jgi:hypothetical protein